MPLALHYWRREVAHGAVSDLRVLREEEVVKWLLSIMVGVALTMSAGAALAQAGGDSVLYKKRTVIDFTDVMIQGELTKPEGSYIVDRKLSRFSSLIKLRQDYNFELLSSASDL